MKNVEKCAAQGDVVFRKVSAVPDGFSRVERDGRLVVAHSETGHHHAIDDTGVTEYRSPDPLRCYLVFESAEHAEVTHHRSFDTHEALCLGGGIGAIWEVIRQREWAPEGWRRVED